MLSSLLLTASVAWAAAGSLFETGSHCVAYKVEKVVFFVKKDAVVGRNCDVSAQVLPEVGGLYHIEVNIPIRSFKSGEGDRDRDVMKILKADEKPDLTFVSKPMAAEDWRGLFAKGEFDIEGNLQMGGKSYPVKLNSKYVESGGSAEVDGMARVRFSDFDLKPPRVGGGILAKVKPDFELHFHFVSHRILGADSIKLPTGGKSQ
ncbi:MAG: YceI family protein [Bdellovibrionales bacterium]